jgi:5-methylthioadenosine/S-adenosylhomocysteine deaminase
VILIRGGSVLSADGARVEPADLLVEGDRIAAAGTALPAPADAEILDASFCLVLPGLVNAHVHAHNNLARGLVGSWTLEDFLSYGPALLAGRTPEEQHLSALVGAVEMLKRGCTSAFDLFTELPGHTAEGIDAVADAYARVGMRATLAAQMVDLPFLHTVPGLLAALPESTRTSVERLRAAPAEQLLETAEGFVRRWHGSEQGRIEVALAPSIPVGCSDAFLAGCRRLQQEYGVALHTHLDETKVQAVQARLRWGTSATRKLAELGVLGPRFVAAHAVWVTDEDLKLLAESGASLAHNPASNLRIGSGIAPIREALEAGVNVALGTDGSAASDNLDMFTAMHLAALVNRIRFGYGQERWLNPDEVLRMATVGGAGALGASATIGALEVGRKADLVLVRLDEIGLAPLNHALNAVVFREAGAYVRTVLVDGRMVVREGRVQGVDERLLWSRANEAAERIRTENREAWRLAELVAPHLGAVCRHLAGTDVGLERLAAGARGATSELGD